MRGARFAWLMLLLCAMATTWARTGSCHDVVPGSLSLEETAPGKFLLRWIAPSAARAGASAIDPEFPEHCQLIEQAIDCGGRGLSGDLRFAGLEGTVHRIVVRVLWLDGSEETRVASADVPLLSFGRGTGEAGWDEVRRTIAEFTLLGIEHIVSGWDHLLFVLGLVLLVRAGPRLLATVTAFTLAHSLTLVMSVLGWMTLPSAAVEVVIALSIVLLAVECATPRPSLTRRAPWLVAFAFGLLHGFGFAGALAEIGLPPRQIGVSLASFNLGVELGQIAVVVPAWLLLRAASRVSASRRLELGMLYAMGTLAVYWTLDRIWLLLSVS